MKNPFLLLALVLIVLVGSANAQTPPTTFATNVYKSKNDKICLYIEKKTNSTASVSIYNSKGILMTRNYFPKNVMLGSYKFDVSQLAAGSYTIVIRNKNEQEVHNLEISNPQVITERLVTVR